MKLADFPALTKLPKRQRLQLAEELWFSSVDDALPVSKSQRQILSERWGAYRKGQIKRLTLAELERRILAK